MMENILSYIHIICTMHPHIHTTPIYDAYYVVTIFLNNKLLLIFSAQCNHDSWTITPSFTQQFTIKDANWN